MEATSHNERCEHFVTCEHAQHVFCSWLLMCPRLDADTEVCAVGLGLKVRTSVSVPFPHNVQCPLPQPKANSDKANGIDLANDQHHAPGRPKTNLCICHAHFVEMKRHTDTLPPPLPPKGQSPPAEPRSWRTSRFSSRLQGTLRRGQTVLGRSTAASDGSSCPGAGSCRGTCAGHSRREWRHGSTPCSLRCR